MAFSQLDNLIPRDMHAIGHTWVLSNRVLNEFYFMRATASDRNYMNQDYTPANVLSNVVTMPVSLGAGQYIGTQRYNFTYAGEFGRVYVAQSLDAERGTLEKLLIERKGNGPDYPTVLISSAGANYQPKTRQWTLRQGEMHVIRDSSTSFNMSFEKMLDSRMTEQPMDLMAKPRSPQEMRYRELSRFIHALERSGGNGDELRVERALKIAIPITICVAWKPVITK